MSRAPGVQDRNAGFRVRIIFWWIKRRLGRLSLGTRMRAYDPKLLQSAARMDLYVASPGKVATSLKELALLKVAAMVGCPS